MSEAPRFDLDLARLANDPYPDLATLRAVSPVAYVPQLDAMLLTKRSDIHEAARNAAAFSSQQPGSLMNKLMGENFMKRDGVAHSAERDVLAPALSARKVAALWRQRFQEHAGRILEELEPRGSADLIEEFALPFCAECLKSMTGLTNVPFADMDAWSQAMMDGISNYAGDAGKEARCRAATAGIDAAIDERLPALTRSPDDSLLGAMVGGGMALERIRINLKLAISGGQNEPRKAIAGTVWALLSHPDQLTSIIQGGATWADAFDEFVRWIAPIGMIPRAAKQPVLVRGVEIPAGRRVLLMLNSGNRDEEHVAAGDRFDLHRPKTTSVTFGSGPHFCMGTWASRAMAADVALPALFARLTGLKLSTREPVRVSGWVFRGVQNLPVTWN